ncbi:hypothetical protein BJ546DRAFT_837308 [Cryomyces antarcticus]|nr:hypothetical protein LTR60_001855 [Cryomyces antarcticus]
MKRKAPPSKTALAAKKARPEVPDYHLTPSTRDEAGEIVWPAPKDQMGTARDFILECAKGNKRILIVPDKDADGLTSGVIVYCTLRALGLPEDLISVHHVQRANSIFSDSERAAMASKNPSFIIVLDQGSRPSPPLIPQPHQTLIIDHHYAPTSASFPLEAVFCTANASPPVATSSLLTYILCTALHPSLRDRCAALCVIGTHGDLGNSIKWEAPFPDMTATFKQYTRKALNDAVALVNAPRRTAAYNVHAAWDALLSFSDSGSLTELLQNKDLLAARSAVSAEVERCTHSAPKFSADGRIAVLRIASQAQVHGVIATRWAGHLKSEKLEVVMVANEGYSEGKFHFSCRAVRGKKGVDIIALLEEYANASDEPGKDGEEGGTLRARLGENFAQGHVQASGGIVKAEEFEELMRHMRVGEKVGKKPGEKTSPKKGGKKGDVGERQKNTLTNYFSKSNG